MERATTLAGNLSADVNPTNPVSAKVVGAAQAAHKTTDRIADKATAQVDRSAEAVHRAVDGAADATTSAADWALTMAEQAKQVRTRLTDSASASIRARPIVTVAGALIVGYLLGRLARL
jgi:protein involved in polysaccharide export with SLBB domain